MARRFNTHTGWRRGFYAHDKYYQQYDYGSNNGSLIIDASWNGIYNPTVTGNAINALGSNMTAIAVKDSATSSILAGIISNNSIYFKTAAATSGTGIWMVDGQSGQISTVTSTMTMQNNLIQFQGTGGTGLRFGLYGITTDTIAGNNISDWRWRDWHVVRLCRRQQQSRHYGECR